MPGTAPTSSPTKPPPCWPGAGIAVHLLPKQLPTPLLAFAVRRLAAAAGIMITASHNPPADNGYKLYLDDGAQVIPPADAEIEAAINGHGALSRVPLAEPDSALITRHGDEMARAYLDAVCALSPAPQRRGLAALRLHAAARRRRGTSRCAPSSRRASPSLTSSRPGRARPGFPDGGVP